MKLVELSRGGFARVDDEDFERISQHKWYAWSKGKTTYAVRNHPDGGMIMMHKEIYSSNLDIDHRDRDGLNNCKNNLRPATKSQNQANTGLRINNTSGIKGVYFNKKDRRWMARITVNQKMLYLGSFIDPLEAKKAYDAAAKKYFGEYANAK